MVMLGSRRSAIRKLAGFGLLLAGSLILSPMPAAAASSGTEVIRQFYAQLLDTMQRAAALGVKGRYHKLEPIVFAAFDVPYMARLSIGPAWAGLTPDQKKRATLAYVRNAAPDHATRFDVCSGELP